MILVDTSIWIDHFRHSDPQLAAYLNNAEVLMHPFVIGELALGNFARRAEIISYLINLPRVTAATEDEVLEFIEANKLFGLGIGYVDAHLLASVRLTPGTKLWTRDKKLSAASKPFELIERRN